MTMTTKQKQAFKAQAHQLKPVVIIGAQGITENVNKEIDRALTDHELIKIKIAGADKSILTKMADRLCEQHQAEKIQIVGHILTIYRQNEE